MKKCPRCGSKNTAKILYGLPSLSDKLIKQLEDKEVVLGGCAVSLDNPKYHCNSCNKDFGTSPVLYSKHGVEKYPDIVRSIHFSDGGFFGGYRNLTMLKRKDHITVDAWQSMTFPLMELHREMQFEEWEKVLDALYNKLYLHEWKKRYYAPVMDGEQWKLEIHLSGNRIRTYSGSNDFPPYWKELKALFKLYFEEMTPDPDENCIEDSDMEH